MKTVKEDVNKQQTKEGKEKLVKKYDAEFAKKQEAIKKNYATKLTEIEKTISSVVAKEAKKEAMIWLFRKPQYSTAEMISQRALSNW